MCWIRIEKPDGTAWAIHDHALHTSMLLLLLLQNKFDLDNFYAKLKANGSVEEISPAVSESFWQVFLQAHVVDAQL